MFNLIGGAICLVFLVMSWFLSVKVEKDSPQPIVHSQQTIKLSQQLTVNNPQLLAFSLQPSVNSRKEIVHSQQKTSKQRKTSKPLSKIEKEPKPTSIIIGIPPEREKTWQLKKKLPILGPQAIAKISIEKEPLPLRGGLGVSAPKEIKRYEVAPPNILLKQE